VRRPGVELSESDVQAIAKEVCELLRQGREGFLDVAGAAAYLSLTPKAIYHLASRGQIPCHKPAGRLLFCPEELREWVRGSG
jgi:hypothetical protein